MATLPASAISLFHFDSDITDALGNATLTNNGVTLSTAQSKFGAKSAYFNGTATSGNSAIITLPTSNVYTLALWIYKTETATFGWNPAPFCTGGAGTPERGSWVVAENAATYMPVYSISDASGTRTNKNGTTAITNNAWHHLALTRNGDEHKFYLDGVRQATLTIANSANSNIVYLGFANSSSTYFKGFISEIIISSDMLWTANFSPPTTPYETVPPFDPATAAAKIQRWYFGGR